MSLEANKAVIRRLSDEFWNKGNAGVIDETFSDAFVDRTPAPGLDGGRESFRAFALGLRAAMPDARSTVHDVVAEGDKVAWRWSFQGTQTESLMGMPATGKPVTMKGITIDRLAGGRVVERWSEVDTLGFLQQLGAMPMPGDDRTTGSDTEQTKHLVRAYFEAGHRDDLAAWDALCAAEMRLVLGFAPAIEGLAGVKGFTAGMHAAFSPFFLRVEKLLAEGNEAAAWWTTGGTHTGTLMSPAGPIPPTGREMAMAGVSLLRVENGKIVEERVLADLMGAMQQLGVLPGA